MNKTVLSLAVAAVLATFGSLPALAGDVHHHDGDVVIGRTGAGQVAFEFDLDEAIGLPPVDGVITGWALDDPGFTSLSEDEPGEDFFMLPAGVEVTLEVVAIDAALSAWTPGFADRLDAPGEAWVIGAGSFDEHLIWHIDSTVPEFNELQSEWTATFRLVSDEAAGLSPTDSFTMTFAAVPEPGTLLVLGLGAGVAASRRPLRRAGCCRGVRG